MQKWEYIDLTELDDVQESSLSLVAARPGAACGAGCGGGACGGGCWGAVCGVFC